MGQRPISDCNARSGPPGIRRSAIIHASAQTAASPADTQQLGRQAETERVQLEALLIWAAGDEALGGKSFELDGGDAQQRATEGESREQELPEEAPGPVLADGAAGAAGSPL